MTSSPPVQVWSHLDPSGISVPTDVATLDHPHESTVAMVRSLPLAAAQP